MTRTKLWTPSLDRVQNANITKYGVFVRERGGGVINNYSDLYNWSISYREQFWKSIWEYMKIKYSIPPMDILTNDSSMLNANWFEGARLNFAENLLRNQTEDIALIFNNESGESKQFTYNQLYAEVSIIAQALKHQGVGVGDRVAGLMPNIIETVICMLATTSIGAIWSSTSPDFGFQGAYDRFFQIGPKILITTKNHTFSGVVTEQLPKVTKLAHEISSIKTVVVIDFNSENVDKYSDENFISWEQFKGDFVQNVIEFEQLPFDHPIYILYTSGTTGKPKCIVHGAGGTLLQHAKELVLHTDLKAQDTLLFITSCGWMMWNWMVSALFVGAKVVLFDGSPFFPNEKQIFKLIEKEKITIFGAGAKYFESLKQLQFNATPKFNVESIKTVLSTGSPLSKESFEYIYNSLKSDVLVSSISGGTDIVSCFALGNPTLDVYAGEIQCWGLGMDCVIFDESGHRVVDQKGELVCKSSFPSQPVFFWGDENKQKYSDSYFKKYDHVWAHGDYALEGKEGGIIIFGRSDATLKPNGIRIGTSEIYQQVDYFEQVQDALIVDVGMTENKARLLLFVKMKPHQKLDSSLITIIKRRIRDECSINHVPSEIFEIEDIPYTMSGKKVEIAVKRIICGQEVMNIDSLRNPESLEYFKKWIKEGI